MDGIIYSIGKDLTVKEFRQVLVDSTLGERRPIDDQSRLEKMLKNANLVVAARLKGVLIGVARSISDFTYCTYLSDLAVSGSYQKMGIGKELIRLTKIASDPAKLILLAAPAARDYYPRIGMTKHDSCYFLTDAEELK